VIILEEKQEDGKHYKFDLKKAMKRE